MRASTCGRVDIETSRRLLGSSRATLPRLRLVEERARCHAENVREFHDCRDRCDLTTLEALVRLHFDLQLVGHVLLRPPTRFALLRNTSTDAFLNDRSPFLPHGPLETIDLTPETQRTYAVFCEG